MPPNRHQTKFETRQDIKQAYLYLGHKVPGEHHEDTFKLRFLNGVFSAGLSSRMFQKLREKHGIGYSVGTFYYSSVGVGLFGAVTDLTGDDVERLQTRLPMSGDELIDAAAVIRRGSSAVVSALMRSGRAGAA